MSLNHKMAEAHEKFLARLLGARLTKASGSQWSDQMDARMHRYDAPFAWAVDGKSTLAKSIGVSRAMLAKAVEQAQGERPLIGLRFYDDERLKSHDDWVVLRADDFQEMLWKIERSDGEVE